jgi:hypothetical protein
LIFLVGCYIPGTDKGGDSADTSPVEVPHEGTYDKCQGDKSDRDEDGYDGSRCEGIDCNDGNPNIHPGAAEVCGDGVDQDCSGEDKACE